MKVQCVLGGFLQRTDALGVEIISVNFQRDDFIFHCMSRP